MKRKPIFRSLFVFAIAAVLTAAGYTSATASTTLVISQVDGGGGGSTGTYLFDYVELFNISSSPQSLNGLSIMYGASGGQFGSSAGNIQALPNVTLNPGQHYLIQLGGTGTAGAPLPVTADLSNTTTNMSASSGKVALVTAAFAGNTCGATATPCTLPNANIIDLVSYGAANNAEGGASVNNGVALTSAQGGVRKANGCTDSDNNNNDFDVITAPVPRNTASTATPCAGGPAADANVDMNGDGKTDYVVVRGTGSALTEMVRSGAYPAKGFASVRERMRFQMAHPELLNAPSAVTMFWYTLLNGSGTIQSAPWGDAQTDTLVPEDYDGDHKDDIAVWRLNSSNIGTFYILQSSDSTLRSVVFGGLGHDPTVAGDYDGDGKADPATFECPLIGQPAGPCKFWYLGSLNNPSGSFTAVNWGVGNFGDFVPDPGDFDGDGKNDFCVQRDVPGSPGQGQFALFTSAGNVQLVNWGLTSDFVIPGDYDGDGKADFTVYRSSGGSLVYYTYTSAGAVKIGTWGNSATDIPAPGDYDGDGKLDLAVYRVATAPNPNTFWVYNSSNAAVTATAWGTCQAGQPCDLPAAAWNVH